MGLNETQKNFFKKEVRSGNETYNCPTHRLEKGSPPMALRGEYNADGIRRHNPTEKYSISNREKQKREGPSAIILAALLTTGALGVGMGMINGSEEQKKEVIRGLILENLTDKTTQKEGLQMINRNLPLVNEEIIKKLKFLKFIDEQEKLNNLAIDTLSNLTIKNLEIKKEILSYFLSILEEENGKETKDKKEMQKNDQYKEKIRNAIKKICNYISENPKVAIENISIIINLSTKCSDDTLREWAKNKIELLKEKMAE